MPDISHFLAADGAALLFATAALVWLSRRALTEPKRRGRRSAHMRHRDARRRWLDGLVGKPSELLAVHTLRNWIMSTTFLASTSILLALGLLAAAFSNDKLSAFAHGLNLLGNESGQLWMLKALLLVATFLVAFFAFALSMRAFVHLGFMINSPAPAEGAEDNAAALTREMDMGAFCYWFGIRCYYASALLTLWLFGPIWMAAGTVGLIVMLRRID